MKVEQPYKGNAILEETITGYEIISRPKRNYFVLVFLGIWLCGWTFGGSTVLMILFTGDMPGGAAAFLVFWLGGWAAGLFFGLNTFLWQLKGQEVLIFEREHLTIKKEGVIPSKSKNYRISEISKVKYNGNNSFKGFFGNRYATNYTPFFMKGDMSFHYGYRTVTFGLNIDEPEAEYILRILVEKNILKQEQLA